jgi:hypothetical protein
VDLEHQLVTSARFRRSSSGRSSGHRRRRSRAVDPQQRQPPGVGERTERDRSRSSMKWRCGHAEVLATPDWSVSTDRFGLDRLRTARR